MLPWPTWTREEWERRLAKSISFSLRGEFEESEHPRVPAGSGDESGQFAEKGIAAQSFVMDKMPTLTQAYAQLSEPERIAYGDRGFEHGGRVEVGAMLIDGVRIRALPGDDPSGSGDIGLLALSVYAANDQVLRRQPDLFGRAVADARSEAAKEGLIMGSSLHLTVPSPVVAWSLDHPWRMALVHYHPNGSSISPGDVTALMKAKFSSVVAFGERGEYSQASMTPLFRSLPDFEQQTQAHVMVRDYKATVEKGTDTRASLAQRMRAAAFAQMWKASGRVGSATLHEFSRLHGFDLAKAAASTGQDLDVIWDRLTPVYTRAATDIWAKKWKQYVTYESRRR